MVAGWLGRSQTGIFQLIPMLLIAATLWMDGSREWRRPANSLYLTGTGWLNGFFRVVLCVVCPLNRSPYFCLAAVGFVILLQSTCSSTAGGVHFSLASGSGGCPEWRLGGRGRV